jgi:hypothetical protein
MGITDTLGSHWKHQFHIDSEIEPDGYWVMVDPLEGELFYTLVVDASDTRVLQHTIKVREESPRRAAERAVAWLEREWR